MNITGGRQRGIRAVAIILQGDILVVKHKYKTSLYPQTHVIMRERETTLGHDDITSTTSSPRANGPIPCYISVQPFPGSLLRQATAQRPVKGRLGGQCKYGTEKNLSENKVVVTSPGQNVALCDVRELLSLR